MSICIDHIKLLRILSQPFLLFLFNLHHWQSPQGGDIYGTVFFLCIDETQYSTTRPSLSISIFASGD